MELKLEVKEGEVKQEEEEGEEDDLMGQTKCLVPRSIGSLYLLQRYVMEGEESLAAAAATLCFVCLSQKNCK